MVTPNERRVALFQSVAWMKCNGIREDWCTTLPDSVTLHPGYIIAISQQNSDFALVLDPGGKQPISDIPPRNLQFQS
ncbi:MAG: hypothetical protein ABW108_06970 [Candidatus Thiodiazotropha sp. 6PLUC10]